MRAGATWARCRRRGQQRAPLAGSLCAAALAALLLAPRAACAQQGAAPASESQATQPPASNVPQGTPRSQPGRLPAILVTPNPPRARAAAKKRRPARAAALPAPPALTAVAPQADGAVGLVSISPVAGSDVPIDKFPGSVSTANAAELTRSGGTTVQQMLEASVPGITVSNLQGNDFQAGVQYRGFSASPVDGVPQGLAVYQNGVRINEVFGDTVNWDFLPAVAVNNITVMSNNPVFGLNAIGGAVSIAMKDGFAFQGVEADVRLGSFGDRRGALQVGARSGPWAAYVALEDIHDDGFRAEGASDIRRAYGDLAARGDGSELHLSITAANNVYGVAAASPVQLLDQGWGRVFTIPQTTENRMEMLAANATVAASDTLKLSGVVYYRHFGQEHIDGNVSSAQDCGGLGVGMPGFLCLSNVDGTTTPLLDQYGRAIPTPAGTVGELDRTTISADGYGGSLQATDKSRLLGHDNQLVVGTSIDHGRANYHTSAEIGIVSSDFFVEGTGAIVANSDLHPVAVGTTTTYYGLFFSDTFDITQRLAVTAGGRYNFAQVALRDANGLSPNLNGEADYSRFNPMLGVSYQIVPGVALYSGYSEANRVPVPAELACADPNRPCLVPAFLTSDPALKQVVAHTAEAGVRGTVQSGASQTRLAWGVGLFHTLDNDDIINGYSPLIGRSFVQNGGNTLRQGVEAKISYRTGSWLFYANYTYVDATFRSTLTLNSPNNPLNPTPGSNFITVVHPGDLLPGIPAQTMKVGFEYGLTPQWKAGAVLLGASSQVFFGDEANHNARLPGYATLAVHTSYDVSKNLQLYAIFNNILDQHYATYGTYFDTASVSGFTDPRSIVPAQPFSAYAGMKLRY